MIRGMGLGLGKVGLMQQRLLCFPILMCYDEKRTSDMKHDEEVS